MDDKEKEFVSKQVFDLKIEHLKEIIVEKEKALVLQAKEYERRLELLNGEHRTIQDNQNKSVLREIYNSEQGEQNKKIDELMTFKNNQQGSQKTWGVITLVLAAIISYIINK